jgi:hypothetical protein
LRVTRRLGDSIHAYAVMAALAAEGGAGDFVAYRPFASFFARGPLPVSASDRGTQWRPCARPFHGPWHGEHVRDTMAAAAGVRDRSLLELRLALPSSPPDRPYLVVCPDAGAAYKEWPRERWGAVVEYLLSRRYGVFICGMPGRDRLPAPEGATHLDLGVADLATLVAAATALVGPDSGHLHLADALGVPAVGLYGATSSLTYGPYRDRTLCVDVHAEQARTRTYNSARHLPGECMRAIPVDRVLEILARIEHAGAPCAR